MKYQNLSNEEKIRCLEKDLYEARSTILNLMPDHFQTVFEGYISCKSQEQIYEWMRNVKAKVVELATPSSHDEESYERPRVLCPLCGRGSRSVVCDQGFILPDGLMKHLEGTGNAQQCRVMEAIDALADDYLEPISLKAEQARLEERERRRNVEILYKTSAGEEPLLVDESLYCGKGPRNENELIWAEQRLGELGFQLVIDGRVKQYTMERQDVFIFADPRGLGEISFRVFRKPLPKRGRGKFLRGFSIKDNWNNDVKSKFEARLIGSPHTV